MAFLLCLTWFHSERWRILLIMTTKGGTILARRGFKLLSRPLASAAVCRFKSTCASTMDLISEDRSEYTLVHSTLQHVVERDFVDTVVSSETSRGDALNERLLSSATTRSAHTHVESHEMDLVEAAAKRRSFDQILLLVHHGERQVVDGVSCLTGRGVGQALNLSRRVATFCNEETELMPDLVVTAPTQQAVQTALLAFPHYSPESVKSVSWICHPKVDGSEGCMDLLSDLKKAYDGIDYSLCENQSQNVAGVEDEEAILQRADTFLEWLRSRDEKVIVGKSH